MTNRRLDNLMTIIQRLFAKVRGTIPDFHRGRTSMKSYTGYTHNGVEVSCKIDPEKSEAIVEYEEYLRFLFNPDFPQEAKAFFDALCNVRGIVMLLAACSTATPASDVTTNNTVHMNASNFVESSITIKKGESVTLVADTLTPHIIANGTWENGSPKRAQEPGAPDIMDVQVNGNSSQNIDPFTTAGTFKL